MPFFNNYFFQSSNNYSKNNIDLPTKVYDSINWNKSVVGGSFALKLFIKAKWEANDVDIMMESSTKEEFNEESIKFEQKSEAVLIKEAWFSGSHPVQENIHKEQEINIPNELFHESILGSKTYKINDFPLPIQLIAVNTLKNSHLKRDLLSVLNETTDIPACVNYKVIDGQKIFNVPEKGLEILLTKKGKKVHICKSRLDKYMKRGFSFY